LLVNNLPDDLVGRHIGNNGLHRLNQENNPAGLGVDKFFVEVLRKLSDFGRSREKNVSAEKNHVPSNMLIDKPQEQMLPQRLDHINSGWFLKSQGSRVCRLH
jgi:hypothetical protein